MLAFLVWAVLVEGSEPLPLREKSIDTKYQNNYLQAHELTTDLQVSYFWRGSCDAWIGRDRF